jgi:hypothetical protein
MPNFITKQKLPLYIAIMWVAISNSCSTSESELSPSSEYKVTFNLTYTGTAMLPPGGRRDIFISIKEEGSPITSDVSSASVGEIKNGLKFDFDLHPGNFVISGYWDWNENNKQELYEPSFYKQFSVGLSANSNSDIFLEMMDNTNPNDNGWIEGTISCSNTHAYESHYCWITLLDENGLLNNVYKVSPNPITFANPYKYSCSVEPGHYIEAMIFWDLNDNNVPDYNDLTDTYTSVWIYVSPGLPTINYNFNLD